MDSSNSLMRILDVIKMACHVGNEEWVLRELKTDAGNKVVVSQLDGLNLVFLAAKLGLPSVVEEAIKIQGRGAIEMMGVDRHPVCPERWVDACTPLHVAACYGHAEVARILLKTEEGRRTVTQRDGGDSWSTPLHWAAGNGHLGVAKAILETKEARKALEMKSGLNKLTPLELARKWGHEALAKLLQEAEGKRETAEDSLSCGICFHHFSAADDMWKLVIVCSNGHSFCRGCFGSFRMCPTCGEPCLLRPIVNGALCGALDALGLGGGD